MKRVALVLVVLAVVIAAVVAVLEIGDPDVQTEAALPGLQHVPGPIDQPPPCMNLVGDARDKCELYARDALRRSMPGGPEPLKPAPGARAKTEGGS